MKKYGSYVKKRLFFHKNNVVSVDKIYEKML